MKYNVNHMEKTVDLDSYIDKYVDVPKFMEACKKCPNYEKIWSCPTYDFDQIQYWQQFNKLQIHCYKIEYEESTPLDEAIKVMYEVKHRAGEELFALEKEREGSRYLAAGNCEICEREGKECTRPSGKACAHPERLRYSIESIGGDVERTTKDFFDLDMLWGKDGMAPEYYTLVGGLLFNET